MCRSPKRAPTASTRSLSRKAALPHRGLGLDAGHAGEQRVVLGEGALAHQRHLHRHLQVLGQRPQLGRGVADDDAAAGQDQRALGGRQHVDGRRDGLAASGCGTSTGSGASSSGS